MIQLDGLRISADLNYTETISKNYSILTKSIKKILLLLKYFIIIEN